ncbi:glycosyltransferase [Burkholderia gladioli]|uniref:glycosyltransferase n=1 Tax=Burkholderia gladioli TaxID=28095 RepID=UPI001C23E3D1|nr:glycosyltransferase [Burkholderia gladioli]MBU9275991.1 glycosyltransferase [Burkholderia gladioli]
MPVQPELIELAPVPGCLPVSMPAREAAPIARAHERVMQIYAHLAIDKDAERWRRNRESGKLVGLNDATPYGYGRAEAMQCHVRFSAAGREGRLGKLLRLGLRAVIGFDLLHAWRNRDAIRVADVVWTHTESQYLAVAAVGLLIGKRVRLIGQSVWLVDRWRGLWWPHKWLFRRLIARVDVLSFLSPENAALARQLFPHARVEFLPFGIPAERRQPPRCRVDGPIRVLALGNDRHRDWATLIEAVRDVAGIELTILSGTVPAGLASGARNVEIRLARSHQELSAAFEAATLVCVPLRRNLHASGITVIQEVVLSGLPVIATDIGGLSAYFSADELRYVPMGEAAALREAIVEVAGDPAAALARATRAQARMGEGGELGAQQYVRHHVRLSAQLLGRDA